jgi:predicted HTH domain antitoxin
MPLLLEIPDEVLESLRLPREEIEAELRAELAAILYSRGAISLGNAAEMACLSRWAFDDLLARRKIVRNYSSDDLEQDLAWAQAHSKPKG